MDENAPVIRYIALINSLKQGDNWLAEPGQVSYAFHTFSLRNEHLYLPTGDVSFVSPNTDPRNLDGGVERLIDAVLHLSVKVHVIAATEAQVILERYVAGDTIEISAGFSRSYEALQSLIEQASVDHPENH